MKKGGSGSGCPEVGSGSTALVLEQTAPGLPISSSEKNVENNCGKIKI